MKRLAHLDGLKGLAAFCVMTGHFYLLFQQSMPDAVHAMERIPLANLLMNGQFAVCLFVVISNYIFAKSLDSHFDLQSLQQRLLKRYFRLAIPIAFIVFVVLVMYYFDLFHTVDLPNEKLHKYWKDLSASSFLKQAIFSPLGYSKVISPCWMLKFIFLGNMFIALLSIIVKGKGLRTKLLLYFFACVLCLHFSSQWICAFAGGALYELDKEKVTHWRGIPLLSLLISVIVAALPESVFSRGNIWYNTVAAVLMFWSIMRLPRMQYILEHKICRFLGVQSLAIYLVHWPILCSLSCTLYLYNGMSYNWSLIQNLALTVLVTMFASVLYTRYVNKWAEQIINKILICLN